eukprot:904205-Pelagomonas_calceolata.AAC.1
MASMLALLLLETSAGRCCKSVLSWMQKLLTEWHCSECTALQEIRGIGKCRALPQMRASFEVKASNFIILQQVRSMCKCGASLQVHASFEAKASKSVALQQVRSMGKCGALPQ